MSVGTIVAGNLSDKRIQLFATLDDAVDKQVWSAWKGTTDPNSDWTDWVPLTAGNPVALPFERVLATARRPDGALQLFADAGTCIATTRKVSADPDAAWSDWENFIDLAGVTGFFGFGVGALSDGRLQAFILKGEFHIPLMTTWMETLDANTAWTELVAFVPAIPGGSAGAILTAPLSGTSLQVWIKAFPPRLFTTWKETSDPSAAWLDWSDFDTPVTLNRPGVPFLEFSASGALSDGRIQLFLPDEVGLLTTWQTAPGPGSTWAHWQLLSVQPPRPGVAQVAAAPLSDGRLQLWGIIDDGRLSSSWKVSTDPDAAWTDWSDFQTP